MKRRNLFFNTALMCTLLIVSFTFDSKGIYWLWKGDWNIPIILAVVSAILWGKLIKNWVRHHKM